MKSLQQTGSASTVRLTNNRIAASDDHCSILRLIGVEEIHPAIKNLVRWQMLAKLKRAVERTCSRRRIPLTIAALLLGTLWLVQALAGILYRSSASSEQLLKWIPLSLCCYAIWNVFKILGQQPAEPFDWTDSEKEWLVSSPLSRTNIIRYRGSSIFRAAFLKSCIFALVMSPDIDILLYGLLGIFAALLLIDLARVILTIVAYGLRPRELFLCRCFVFGSASIVAGTALLSTYFSLDVATQLETAASLGILLHIIQELIALSKTWFGAALTFPFRFMAEVVIAEQYSVATLGKLMLAGTGIVGLAKLVPALDQFFCSRRIAIEQAGFDSGRLNRKRELELNLQQESISRVPFDFGGCGALAWRQSFGLLTYMRSISIALLIPMILSCLPVLTEKSGLALIANVAAAIMFYSAVLLPPTIRFDFRCDIDRLNMLKSLPLSPTRIVAGQLAVPVLLTTAFQFFTLVLFQIMSPFNPLILIVIVVAFLPFNIFLYSFENLLFLWYPHRVHQEGIQVLLRTILAFTAKSLVFLGILLVTFVWAFGSRILVESILPESSLLLSRSLFCAGMVAIGGVAAAVAFRMLARAFEKFDPSCDLAGLD